jgi:hypothetical protein
VDAAVADLGIDRDNAPAGLLTLGDATFCGYENNFLTGVEDLHEDARQCFWDHHGAGTAAMFITQHRTLEGAPLATVYVTHGSVAAAYRDATRDPLGTMVWTGGRCDTFGADTSSGHTEFECVYPANQPPLTTAVPPVGTPLTLAPAGGCGAASFAAINADQTVSINIYLQFGNEVGVTDIDYSVPDPVAIVELRRGNDLGEGICNDVISNMRVDTKSDAVAGTLHLVTTATPDAAVAGACGAMAGTLTVSGLEFADGTKVNDLDITTTGLNCFAG